MAGGIAGHYRIWFDISGYDASACDNGTISDGYAGENRAAGAQPDVITDLYIASCAIVILYAGSFFDERWEGKRADPICAMKSPQENLYVTGNRAISTDAEGRSLAPVINLRHPVSAITYCV